MNFEKFRNFSAMHQRPSYVLVHEVPGGRKFSGCLDADTAVKYGNKYDGNIKTKNP